MSQALNLNQQSQQWRTEVSLSVHRLCMPSMIAPLEATDEFCRDFSIVCVQRTSWSLFVILAPNLAVYGRRKSTSESHFLPPVGCADYGYRILQVCSEHRADDKLSSKKRYIYIILRTTSTTDQCLLRYWYFWSAVSLNRRTFPC